ncbi:MAG: diaminopimelate epimerase [Proteobacteria bacterium]|nr:diaminopimelate epimerase [Pseudomonadota bacterium]
MHGLGNDFMVIDATKVPFSLDARQIKSAADRRLGVGFDQLLVIGPPSSQEADFDYLIFNGDGVPAEQCGNGARCVARFITERGLSDKRELKLLTVGKITLVRLERDQSVTAEITEPYFEPSKIPFQAEDQQKPPYEIKIAGKRIQFYVAGIGNPHAVIISERIDSEEVQYIGSQLTVHARFPEGVNVGFMQIITPEQIKLQVFERGSGITLACGSGACAAVAVGRKLGFLQEKVQVNQTGGDLLITWQGPGHKINMRGPAAFVYDGDLFL